MRTTSLQSFSLLILLISILMTVSVMFDSTNPNRGIEGISTAQPEEITVEISPNQNTGPMAIYSNVNPTTDGIEFTYFVENFGPEAITALYVMHDAADLIDPAMITSPEGWEFATTGEIILGTDSWQYIYWFLSPSSPIDFAISPGSIMDFSYIYTGDLTEHQIADGIWSVSSIEGSETFYNDPFKGQVTNSTLFVEDFNAYNNGLSDIPTIVNAPQGCFVGPNLNATTYEVDHNTPLLIADRSENYTKDIDPHGYEQGWSTAGNWGCLPTALGYSLSWWGEQGVAPVNDTDGENTLGIDQISQNPINVSSFDDINDLVEELIDLTNTTSTNGTTIIKVLEGLKQFFDKHGLPLKMTHYSYGQPLLNDSSGIPNPDNIIDEFMDKREDVTLILAYRGAGHALTVVGLNRTYDPDCGYKITLLDPNGGTEIETCMKSQYFNGTPWTEDPTGDQYGKIWYKGKWRGITGSIAISPSDPQVEVEDAEESSIVSHNQISLDQTSVFAYQVTPKEGYGALVDTFSIDTQVRNSSLFSQFVIPSTWEVTLAQDDDGFVRIYFHNNLFNGAQTSHLGLDGFEFSFQFSGTSTTQGMWYSAHSGLPTIDNWVEDTGIVFVPLEEEIPSSTGSITPSSTTESEFLTFRWVGLLLVFHVITYKLRRVRD